MAQTVLVVDDEPNIVLSLQFLMERLGCRVQVAENGDVAMRSLANDKPDLVLLDIMMPKRDGFSVCRAIRNNRDWQDIKIVLLTARGRQDDIKKGLELGADAYITKPFSTKEVVGQVKTLLERTG